MEINLEKLSDSFGNVPKFNPLPKYAEEKRDLALVMSKEITCGQVEDCIKESCAYVTDVKLFDVYEGKPIPEDKKSVMYKAEFKAPDRSLTGEEADNLHAKIVKNLGSELGAELR